MQTATNSPNAPRGGSTHRRRRWAEAVFWAWLVAVGVDLFYNAGVFSPLFDRSREPGLLADDELFARIPVAYLVLAVEVTALAWVLDRVPAAGVGRGALLGAVTGALLGLGGVIWLWTAIDMTAAFVGAAFVVQVSMFAAAGAVLGAAASGTSSRRLRVTCSAVLLLTVVLAVLAQNLLM